MDSTVAVAVINGVFALVLGWLGYQNNRIKHQAKQNHSKQEETLREVRQVSHQTNGELNRKIKEAVKEVFYEHQEEVSQAVITEAMRNLLDAMLQDPNDNPLERRHR